ncbi:carbohydrate kinase [Paracoccus suum]|uniref:Carbohydrate kinase n=1 Tax=Paracoccus suum TaxID=2259340 RepID=A0A344PIA1_9RHOB|nr:carbohydrate kinase [Paracoccus suum]AXC49106.1 carbohydrate kinase [Paracoccus suum]
MILCCGEALIDMVPVEGGACFRPLPGGAVYNSAVALGRLGAPAGFLWPLSRDPFAAMLRAPLAEAGVAINLCPEVDRPTTLAFVTLTGGEARYDFYDDGTAGRLFSPADLPPALPDSVEALLIGGISLVPDPCGATVEALAAREAGNCPIFLDPNVRAFFIADAAAHRARLMRLIRLAAIVKLSADDLAWLWPGRQVLECVAEVLSRGPSLVLTTDGANGATAHRRQGAITVPSMPVTVADTIGAGDTFNAGVMAGLHRLGALSHGRIADLHRDDLTEALSLGVRAAAICVSRPGANPPWAEEI